MSLRQMRIQAIEAQANLFIRRYCSARRRRSGPHACYLLAIFMRRCIFLSEISRMPKITFAAVVVLASTWMHAAPPWQAAGQAGGQPEPALSPAETAALT